MKQQHKSAAAIALTAVLTLTAGCTTGIQANTASASGDEAFPDPGLAWVREGTFPTSESLRLMAPKMTRDQVYALLGPPHFKEGFNVSEWNYIFNLRTGKGSEYVSCQYKIVFRDRLTDVMSWNDPKCANYSQPKLQAQREQTSAAISVAVPVERFRLNADALFSFDRATLADLLPAARQQLDAVAAQLKGSYKRLDSVVATGYTDRLGGDAYNLRLSRQRAGAVGDYLVSAGVPRTVVSVHGAGKAQPLTHCASDMHRQALIACLQPDRRVELEISGER